mmetsp:Transcript_11387/g.10045  ORF Transcript_11387/g.10045 Transcript_11387/m.10045 type:complete len:321 (-) Transcript_11387:54-1016(-)
MKEYKEFSNRSGYQVLIPIIRALICYNYEKGKRAFNEYYDIHKIESSIGNDIISEDLDDEIDSDEEVYSSDEEANIEDNSVLKKVLTLAKIKSKSKEEKKDYNRNSVVDHSDISLDLRTDKGGNFKSLVYLEKALNVCEKNQKVNDGITGSVHHTVTSTLDSIQVHILKIKFMLGFGQIQTAFDYFYSIFNNEALKASNLDIYVLEAEVLLKYSNDFEKAKRLLNNVLEHDNLNFNALILYAYSYIYYEGKYENALDYLLRAKLVNPKSSELWNLLGNCYKLIDSHSDKAEECFLEEMTVKLEYPEAMAILDMIPSKVSF